MRLARDMVAFMVDSGGSGSGPSDKGGPVQSFRRVLAVLATLVVGAASFALSFVALRDVAATTGAVPAELAWLVPVVIDGGVICGSAIIWSLSKEESRRPLFPFLFVAALVTMSVVVNVNHAGPSLLAKSIAALPPLILLGTLELVASQGRRIAVPAEAHAMPVAAPAGAFTGPVDDVVRVQEAAVLATDLHVAKEAAPLPRPAASAHSARPVATSVRRAPRVRAAAASD